MRSCWQFKSGRLGWFPYPFCPVALWGWGWQKRIGVAYDRSLGGDVFYNL